MGDFFKSTRFKILALLLALVFAFALRSAQTQTAVPMMSVIMPSKTSMISAISATNKPADSTKMLVSSDIRMDSTKDSTTTVSTQRF